MFLSDDTPAKPVDIQHACRVPTNPLRKPQDIQINEGPGDSKWNLKTCDIPQQSGVEQLILEHSTDTLRGLVFKNNVFFFIDFSLFSIGNLLHFHCAVASSLFVSDCHP